MVEWELAKFHMGVRFPHRAPISYVVQWKISAHYDGKWHRRSVIKAHAVGPNPTMRIQFYGHVT